MDQQKFLQQFLDVANGVSQYITVDALEKNVPFSVAEFRFHQSTYGRCIVVELEIGLWFILPKRMGDMINSDERLKWINSQSYSLMFKGRDKERRNMAIIEFIPRNSIEEEETLDGLDSTLMDFINQNLKSQKVLQEVSTQTEIVQDAQEVPNPDEISISQPSKKRKHTR